jgi:hypothetical protein
MYGFEQYLVDPLKQTAHQMLFKTMHTHDCKSRLSNTLNFPLVNH